MLCKTRSPCDRPRRGELLVACGLALALGATAAAQRPRFVVRDLDTLGGRQTTAVAMNDVGMVVGASESTRTLSGVVEMHAFVWQDGLIVDLMTLGGGWSEARDVNDLGQIVGSSTIATGERHAFIAHDGVMQDLNDLLPIVSKSEFVKGGWCGSPPPLKVMVEANAINDRGRIIGCGEVWTDDRIHGFLLIPPFDARGRADVPYTHVDLGRLDGTADCLPLDVNDADVVVGASGFDAFIWDGGIRILDGSTRFETFARALNDWDVAAGWILMPKGGSADVRASLWFGGPGGGRVDLAMRRGWCSSEALAVNESLDVVGLARCIVGPPVAVLWKDAVDPIDLNLVSDIPLAGVVRWAGLEQATDIDAAGRIIGNGQTLDGTSRGFLLEPVSTLRPTRR